MHQHKKAFVFDLDGTLLDTLADLTAAVNHALAINAMPQHTAEKIRRFLGNGVGRLVERAVPQGSDNPLYPKVLADFKAYYVGHCLDATRPYNGVPEMLQALRERGYRLAIVSNKLQAGVTELHHRFFADCIDVAIGEREGIRRKPAPDMVEAALRQLGTKACDAVYVGDSEVDIATARASHIPCISVLWGFRDREELIDSGATTLVETPQEILALA